jgi:hypothetical protein
VSYRVDGAGNQNGTGDLGDAFLEAFAPGGASLGVRAVSGATTIDVSALYAGAPIESFRLTASGDSQQIGLLAFRPASSSGSYLHLGGFGSAQAPVFEVCDVTISGSADVVLSSTGLGIDGLASPTLLDGFEWVRFDFARPQITVGYTNEAVGNANGNVTVADAFLEGYGAGGASLGLIAVSGETTTDVTAAFGGVPLSGFRVVANSDAQRLLTVIHAPEPAASSLAGCALAALLCLARGRAARR